MSGGKGGSSSTQTTIPKWAEDAARQNLARADYLSTIGYVPYYGPDVAAMTPMQMAAMGGTNAAASAFGLGTSAPNAGMPEAGNYGGMGAYSSGPMYDAALAELQARAPGQYAALRAPFIDPITGAAPLAPFGLLVDPATGDVVSGGGGSSSGGLPTERREGSGRAGEIAAGGRGGSFASSQIGSRMPGGVNTRNPGSIGNQVAAAATSGNRTSGAPATSGRPQSRSSGDGRSSGMGGGK